MSAPARTAPARAVGSLLDLLRGFLIGMAELVPGVSGGTVALVTGVYDELIGSASHVVNAGRALVRGPGRLATARAELGRSDWGLLVPLLVGMAAAVLTMAGVMGTFVTEVPEHARGLFIGLVAASVIVPLSMLPPRAPGRRAVVEVAWVVLAAAVAFLLVGLAGGRVVDDPALWIVFLAAAVAICALVVPGVSGSFFLLAVGLYAPTLAAVDGRDLAYIGVFMLGAVVGLGSFVKLLDHLLTVHRRTTLLVMAGLMVGSLRALWPWQGDQAVVDGEAKGAGALVAPYAPVAGPVLLAVLGAVVVLTLVVVEHRRTPAESAEPTA